MVALGSGIPKPGKQVFDRQCARCHALFSTGGKIGPDLTTYRRDDLETMLLNIVNPSALIREGYTTHIVSMIDGRVLSGVLVEEDKNVVVLRGSDGKEIALARATSTPCAWSPLDHARRSAQGPEQPAGARPLRLSAEHAAADRLTIGTADDGQYSDFSGRDVTAGIENEEPRLHKKAIKDLERARRSPRHVGRRSGSMRSRSRRGPASAPWHRSFGLRPSRGAPRRPGFVE